MCLSHLICMWPCLIHTCHAKPMPCSDHAVLLEARHSTSVERRPVGYLPAFGFFQLPRGVPRRLLSEAYQSSSQRYIPTTVKSGSSTLQKRRSVKLSDQQFEYFQLPRGLSRRTRHCRSRAGARHGMCELTAWAQHAVCESAFNGYRGVSSSTVSKKQLLHCAPHVSHIALLYVGNSSMYYSLVMMKVNIFLLVGKHELAPGLVHLFALVFMYGGNV